MVFTSVVFLCLFFPIFFILNFLLPLKIRNYWVLLGSLVFYSWGGPIFISLIVGVTILDFFIVRSLYLAPNPKKKKAYLVASILLNVGVLFYFKYFNFFIENINTVLNYYDRELDQFLEVVLPIGVSFFVFESLTYSIDVYRKVHAPLKQLTDYLMYILFFPKLIAGPIVQYHTVSDQIVERVHNENDKLIGFYRFCLGLAKKMIIANTAARFADQVFGLDLINVNGLDVILAVLAYTIQIYFDFSAYSDMAIGLARMMSIRLPENFDAPYISKNITEFWRRWHISLGNWMKNYLYIPLGGNKVDKKWRVYFNLWIVFLISGFWHGAAWSFIIWGMYHGFFLILDRLFLIKLLNRLGSFASICITFMITMLGWLIFRVEEPERIQNYLQKIVNFSEYKVTERNNFYFNQEFYTLLVFGLVFSFVWYFKPFQRIQNWFYKAEQYSNTQHLLLAPISLVCFAISFSYVLASSFNPFIYFRF